MDTQDVLFSKTQQRLIRVLFAHEAKGLTYTEIVRQAAGGSGAIHRELAKFQAAGLVELRESEHGRLYAPNMHHLVYRELRAIAKKLLGDLGSIAATFHESLSPALAKKLAKKYLWWMETRDVLKDEDRLIAQVMNMGTFDDTRLIEKTLGEERLRRVVKKAAPGYFDAKAWTYWHYRLNLATPGRVPQLPARKFS